MEITGPCCPEAGILIGVSVDGQKQEVLLAVTAGKPDNSSSVQAGRRWPLTAACESLSPKLSQTSSGRFMGLRHPPPPFLLLYSTAFAQTGRAPLWSSVSPSLCPVTLCSLVVGQQRRGMHKTHKTSGGENLSLTQSRDHDVFLLFLPKASRNDVLRVHFPLITIK